MCLGDFVIDMASDYKLRMPFALKNLYCNILTFIYLRLWQIRLI